MAIKEEGFPRRRGFRVTLLFYVSCCFWVGLFFTAGAVNGAEKGFVSTLKQSLSARQKKNAPANDVLAQDPTLLFRVALRLFQRGLYVRALPLLEQFVRDHPDHPDHQRALYMLGDAHYFIASTGIPAEYLNAINAYRLAVQTYPNAPQMPNAYYRLGLSFKAQKLPGEALGAFQLLLDKAPKSPQAPRAQLEIANRYIELNDPESAIAEYRKVSKNYPGSPEEKDAHFGIADALFRQQLYEKAYEQFHSGLKRWPGFLQIHTDLLYNYAETLFQTRRFDGARKAFLEMVNIDPSNQYTHRALARLGDLYLQEKRRDDAIKVYSRVIESYPGTEGALVSRIRLADLGAEAKVKVSDGLIFSLEPFQKPLEAYRYVLAHASKSQLGEVALLRIASFHLNRGEIQQAIATVREFLNKYPTSQLLNNADLILAKSYFELVGRHYRRREFLRAIQTYVEFRALVPAQISLQAKPFSTMLSVGESYMRLGLYTDAVKVFEEILDQPEGVLAVGDEAFFRLTQTTMLMGDRAKAKKLGQRFLTSFPRSPRVASIRAILGEIAWFDGKNRQAAGLLASAVAGELENELRGRSLFLLAEADAQIGRFDESAEAMRHAITLYPKIEGRVKPFSLEQASFRLGDILYEGRRWLGALMAYRDALQSFPDSKLSGWAFHRIARIQGQLDLAKRGGNLTASTAAVGADPFWRKMNQARGESLKWDELNRPRIEKILRPSATN